MTTLQLIPIGESTGVILPRSVFDRMNVRECGALYATEARDGGYLLNAYDPAFAEKMEMADDIARRYRDTL